MNQTKVSAQLIAASLVLITACGTPQNFGVGRNPLGSNIAETGRQGETRRPERVFNGDVDRLRALFLHPISQGKLVPGQVADLEIIAIDDQGRLIDPKRLSLEFTSSKPGVITVNKEGMLIAITPFQNSMIRVKDLKTGTTTEAEFTVTTDQFKGNPSSVASLQLVMRDQVTPGEGKDAQFEIIARDALGNAIDPARLKLDWSVSDPSLFEIDEHGRVVALTSTGKAQVTVRDPISGRVVTGTVQNLFTTDSTAPSQNNNNAVTDRPEPIPSGNPGTPVQPVSPGQGGDGPLELPPTNTGTPGNPQTLTLTPAVTYLPQGDSAQLTVAITDNQGNPINPNTLNLQWVSQNSAAVPVDQTGTVTANTGSAFSRITVSIPGTSLSASAFVNTLPAQSSGGGGGGGSSTTPAPGTPSTYSTPLSTSSFKVHITAPSTTSATISSYRITVGNAPGDPEFEVPYSAGTVSVDVPAAANLDPDTTYPYSVVALTPARKPSAVVNAFGTTLKTALEPTNIIGGSKSFTGIISTPANTVKPLNRASGNALTVGDNSPGEVLTVTFTPTAANFGSVALNPVPALPASVTVSGAGTQGDPLIVSGPKDDVNTALNNFEYTPQNGFVGNATVTMQSSDTVEGVVTADDMDTLIFSVNSGTATPPQNLMNESSTFVNLITAIDTPLALRPLSNSELNVRDENGDTLATRLTPENGTLALTTIPAGLTVTGAGTSADPLVLTGSPFYINAALNGGLTFTPNNGFTGTARITMLSTETVGGASDSDTLDINVVQPSNLFNGSSTFPATPQRMSQGNTTTLNGATSKALTVLYPPTSNVRVNLVLLDGAGNNPGNAANGSLALTGAVPGTVTVTNPGPEGAGSLQLVGPVTDVNSLLTAGLLYSPSGNTTGNFRLRMNSIDTNNASLSDSNDIVNLEVSAVPENRFANDPNGFPPMNNPIELGQNTPLTFAGFFNTPLSVVDNDSSSLTVTLQPQTTNGSPDQGRLTRANNAPIPNGLTVTNNNGTTLNPGDTAQIEGSHAHPMVITGSPAAINSFLNNGIVYTPDSGYNGGAKVIMTTTDGGGTDVDEAYINVLSAPENRRNNDPVFTTTPIQAAPGVEVDMGIVANRLSINNYPANNTNIEVTLSVPTGKGTLRINGVGAGNQTTNSVTITDNQSRLITLRGSQSNINTVLQSLRYTPSSAAVASPETVNLTFSSTGGSSGDSGDLVPFAINNPPRNIYNTQDANETDENNSFPSTGNRLDIFASQPLLLNNTSTATQPQVRLDVVDDSETITVTLTPANTAGNTSAALSLTAAVPNGVGVAGTGTNADPLIISGPTADVKTALALLRYTPQTGFTGNTSFTMRADDGGPAPDTNTVHLNIVARPLNNFDGNATFPATNVLVYDFNNQPNLFQDSATNATIHELSISSLNSYGLGDTATVRLSIPEGVLNVSLSGNVTISAGNNGTNDLTLSATGADIPNLNTVLGTLTYTPPQLDPNDDSDVPVVRQLTMTSGPIPDTDTLNILSTRTPVSLYGNNANNDVNEAFNNVPRAIVTEGTPLNFTGANRVQVGSQATLSQEDSPQIRVTLTPGLIGGTNIGTVSAPIPANGGTRTGSGTNASPLVLTGTPADVNTALDALTFTVNPGVQGNGDIRMDVTDFAAVDQNDLIRLDIRSLPANQIELNNNVSNTFPGTGSPRNVGLNTSYALDGNDVANNSLDRPQLRVNFYGAADTVTVNLSLAGNPVASTGTLTVPATAGVSITTNNSASVQLEGTQANINTALAGLVYNSTNTAGNVDLTMSSTNGIVGDNSGDVVRFSVQNTPPVNSLAGANSGFNNASGNTPLPLRVVSDSTTVEDFIDFGQGDVPALVSAGGLTVTGNSWPTLSVSDDETSVVTTLTPPNFGTLSFRAAIPLVPTGSGTNADPFVLTGSPANINASLAQLRFTPNVNVPNNTNGNLVIATVDGAAQSDVDNISILVERPTVPSTFSGSPNPSGSVFRAVYQFGRDKLPEIVVNDITVSAEQIRNGAQIDIIRYNENDPTNAGDTDTDVLRTVTLNAPAAGETVVFNNQTNRATVTVDFSAAGASVLTRPPGNFNGVTLNEGIGRIGARLKDNDTNGNGGVDGNSDSSVAAASHPYDYFVFPERAQYAVEDVATSRGRWYLINTSTALATGLGRLSMIFDSAGGLNLQNGLNATGDATAGLAKNPVNGDVYYIDDQGTNRGRLIRWIPSRGIQDNPSGRPDPYLVRGGLTVNNGNGTTYNFNDKPARLVFNATDVGGTKTPTLYASAAFIKNDGTGNLSGFYRLRGFEGGHVSDSNLTDVTEDRIRLMVPLAFGGFEELGLNKAFTNSGDMVFEPDTDITAAANNHMILSTGNQFYVSRLPIPNTGTDDVIMDEIPMTAAIFNALRHDGTPSGAPATDFVGLSIDGEWETGSRSFLVITRYAPPHNNISRLYRITYTLTPSANPADPATPTTVTLGTATLLNNGNFNGAYPGTLYNPAGPIPLVDITGAHEE